jgi:hypothetical protein
MITLQAMSGELPWLDRAPIPAEFGGIKSGGGIILKGSWRVPKGALEPDCVLTLLFGQHLRRTRIKNPEIASCESMFYIDITIWPMDLDGVVETRVAE